MNTETPPDDLTSERVRLWLTAHPEFLEAHPELLARDAAASGKVVTLEAGQLNVLRQKNEELSLNLDAMLEQIRRNERIHASFHRIQMRLITAPNPRELLRIATGDPERLFDIHRATIAISNRHPGLWSLCAPSGADPDLDQRLFLVDHKQLADTLRDAPRPVIRVGQEGVGREIFFGPASTQIRSEALIPLFTHPESGPDALIGSLNLGGATPNRFLPSDATDLLRDLADILGLCLARLATSEER
ncbi:MAG: DUF484 family protein [Magnetococcales bacterium]|nr:DUF484 family protein [Magnetococcales bacterium]